MYAAIIGVSMRATSSENITATAAVKANGRKNSPGMPPMNATGTNTAHNVSVVATTARPISIAASVGCFQRFLAVAQMPHDVLDFDDRVVDQHADDQRQREQREQVQRVAEQVSSPRTSG